MSREERKRKLKEQGIVEINNNTFNNMIEKARKNQEISTKHNNKLPTSIKNQVDDLYSKSNNTTENTSSNLTWDNVKNRANNILNQNNQKNIPRNIKINNSPFISKSQKNNEEIDDTNTSINKNVLPVTTNRISTLLIKNNDDKENIEQNSNNSFLNYKNSLENSKPIQITNPLLYKQNIKNSTTTLTNEQADKISKLSSKDRLKIIDSYSNNESERKENTKLVNNLLIQNKATEEASKDNKIAQNGNLLQKGLVYSKVSGKELMTGAVNYMGDVSSMLYNLPTKLVNLTGVDSVQQKNKKAISPEDFTNTYKMLKSGTEQYTSQLEGALGTTARVSNTIGNMLPSIVLGQTLGTTQKTSETISKFASALYSGASEYNNTLNEEQTNVLKATLKGTLYGITTYNVEGITGGNIISKSGSLDDLAINEIKKIKGDIGKKITSIIYDITGETLEENLENWIDHLIDFAFGDSENVSIKSLIEEFKETSKDTAITNLVMQLLGLGGGTYNKVLQSQTIDNINNNNNLSIAKKEALIDLINEQQSTNLINYFAERDSNNISNTNYIDNIKNERYIATNQATIENNQFSNNNQQVNQEQDKMSKNEFSGQIRNNTENTQDNIYLDTKNNINSFNGYTEKEINNMKNEKIRVANNMSDIENFVKKAHKLPGNIKMYLSKINTSVSNKIKATLGLNVDNYNISLRTDMIRHALKEDSNAETEIARGQVPITENDFLNIPNIINSPDNISLSGKTAQGKDVIKFEKNIHGNNVVITYVSDKHKNLEFQTMYKFKNDKKNSLATATNAQALDTTSETNSGTANNIIPRNENNMQVQKENNYDVSSINNNTLQNAEELGYTKSENLENYQKTAQKHNINLKDDTVKSIYEVANKRNVKVTYDDSIFTNKNQNALWNIYEDGTREVVINPNADTKKALQSVTIHELTHDMEGSKEYQALSKTVLEKMKTQEGYSEAIQDLTDIYSKVYDKNSTEFNTLIEQEAVADFLGENLGNQEFLNELVQSQPRNTVQKIYDWIVDKLNKLTGHSTEKLYWKDVKTKFENAFAGIKAKTANYEQLSVAETLEKQGKNAQEIYEQTGWYRGNENKWRYEIDDSNFEIRKDIEASKGYNLNSILLNADELYKSYPQLKDAEINFVDLPKNIAGGYSETFDTYIINNNMINNTVELKKTLLHEIQHNIQAIEDFSRGNSDNWQEVKLKMENKINNIDKQIDNINKQIGFEDYKNNLLDEYFNNNNFNPDEYFSKLEEFQNNSKYAEQIQRLKAQKKSLEDVYGNIKNRDNWDLYKNTAGEQESKNVEDRFDLSSTERKSTLPLVKDEKTVYNIEDKLQYEFNGNKYELFLREDIKNGTDNFDNPIKYNKMPRKNLSRNSSRETTQGRYISRQVEGRAETGRIDQGNSISNSKRNTSKSRELENNSSSFSLEENSKSNQIKSISDIKNKYKDATKYLILNEDETTISINNMVVKEELRNNGVGQNILDDIIKYADENNKIITLTPTTEFNTQNKLKKWYKENGFIENKGRNTDFTISDTMYKLPNTNNNTKLSQDSIGKWQEFLENNSINKGTKTTIQDVKLPQNPNKGLPKTENKRNNEVRKKDVYDTSSNNNIKKDSENFIKQVDSAINGTFPKKDMLTLLSNTPQALQDIGLPNLPITMTQKHLDTIMNKSGKHTGANYHDLGIDIVKQLPEAINNPLDIVKSNTKDDSIVLTTYLADKQDRSIIASIKIDGTGKINNVEIDSNVMTSAYGRNDYESFMKKNLENGNLLYDIDQGVIKKIDTTRSGLQLPRTSNIDVDTVDNVSTTNNIISQNKKNMQVQKENNYDTSSINKNSIITETGNPVIDNKSNEYKHINDNIQTMMPMSKEQREKYYNLLGNDINKIKDNYSKLQKRKENLERAFDLELTSSEDWITMSDEINQIEEEQSIIRAKIDEIEDIPDTINNIVRQRTYEKKTKEERKLEFQKAWVNEYAEIDNLAHKSKNKRLSIALDNFIGSTQSVEKTINGNIKFGTGQTDINGNLKGESLVERLKPIYKNKNMIEFSDYSQLKLNIERLEQGKPNLSNITKTQCEIKIQKYESKYPYFKEVHNSMETFLANELQNAVDAGLGTQEMFDRVREMYPSYIPIFKNITELRNILDNGEITPKMIKKAIGGETEILAVDVACTEYALGMRKKIALNNVLIELKNSLEQQKQLENYINTEITNTYDDFSNTLETKGNESLMEDIDGNKIATCYIDGIAHQFKIPDNYYNLLKSKDIKETTFGQELIAGANNIFRKMVTTYNPAFTIRNAVKDFQSGLYNTKYTTPVYIKNYTRAIKQILTNGKYYQKYRNVGMQGNTIYSKKNGLLIKENTPIIKKAISMPTNSFEFINTQIESAARLSEFISSLEAGNDIDTAKYDASEVTLNFKRGGTTSKAITRYGATFFNSSVLAIEKTIKNVTGKNGAKGMANFIINGLISGVGFSLLNHLIYKDDEDYEELQDYIKDGYFLIKKNDGSGSFYRISKEQLNTAIGSTARRIYQMASGEDDIDELENMFKTIFDNIGVNNPITNNIYAPVGQAIFNKSWYDGYIVSESQQELSPEAQYDYRTNELSKTVANGVAHMPKAVKETMKGLPAVSIAYNILSSPKKSNYVAEQYLGGIGKILMPMATPYAEQNYMEKEMTTNSILKSKYPGEVYDLLDKISKEYNTYGTKEEEYNYLKEATGTMSGYYKEIRELENDKNISNERKKEK